MNIKIFRSVIDDLGVGGVGGVNLHLSLFSPQYAQSGKRAAPAGELTASDATLGKRRRTDRRGNEDDTFGGGRKIRRG